MILDKKWIEKNYKIEGLDQHNRSLQFIDNVIQETNATIQIESDVNNYNSESFAICLQGSSGTNYRILIHYRERIARILRRRIEEIQENISSDSTLLVLMNAFKEMLTFDVHWYDYRSGNWNHICIERNLDAQCWPGDTIVSVIMLLANDLYSCLEFPMNTLRKSLIESYPVSWAKGLTRPEITLSEMANYVVMLSELEKTGSKEEFLALRLKIKRNENHQCEWNDNE